MQNIIPSGASSLYRNNFRFLIDAANTNPGVPSGFSIVSQIPDQSGNGYILDFTDEIWRTSPINYFEGKKNTSNVVLESSGGTPLLISNPTEFSISCWTRSTSGDVGKICGFQDSATSLGAPFWSSGNYDRHIYVGDDGDIRFGCQNGATKVSINGGYVNDNIWKYVVATYADGVMSLYINSQLRATQSSVGVGNYSGYWRLFAYSLGGYASASTIQCFSGDIAFASVYNICLSSGQINQNFLTLRSRFGV